MANNDIADIYNGVAQCYDKKYLKPIHLIEDKIIGKIIKNSISENTKKILDIGCGTGHVIKLADISSKIYQGVDISKESILIAKEKFPQHCFSVADIRKAMPKTKSDLILLIYGQVNYIGLTQSIRVLKQFLQDIKQSQFIAVMYSGDGHSDYEYTKGHQIYYSPWQIRQQFLKHWGIDVFVHGFSFYETSTKFQEQYEKTIRKTIDDGEEYSCKYLIISNKEVVNDG